MTKHDSFSKVDLNLLWVKVPLEHLIKKIQSSFHEKAHTFHTIAGFMDPVKAMYGFHKTCHKPIQGFTDLGIQNSLKEK